MNELAIVLADELVRVKQSTYTVYEDVNLGKRLLCGRCGVTLPSYEKDFPYSHQEWCRIGKIMLVIERSKSYLP